MMYLLFIASVIVIGLLANYLTFTRNKIEVKMPKNENGSRDNAKQELSSHIQNPSNDVENAAPSNIRQILNTTSLKQELSSPKAENHIENQASKLRKRGDHSGAYKASRFLPPIKKGYQIFLHNMGVTGLGFRREAAIAFIDDLNQTLRLELEPENSKDENAIKVIGIGDLKEYFIGYLPKEAALQIVKTNSFQHVYARLVRAYRGTDDYLEIQLQIVGLKEKKLEFDAFAKNLPAKDLHKEYLSYWGISFSNSLTVGEAESKISEHSELAKKDEFAWNEYKLLLSLIDEFDDTDQQESFGIRSVPRKILFETLNKLKLELGSLEEIVDDPELIAERILSEHPELAAD